MIKRFISLIIIFLGIGTGLSLAAGTNDIPVPLSNDGFETANAQGFPSNWHLDKEANSTIRVIIDTQSVHSGVQSLRIDHPQWSQDTIVSDPLSLQVGHLYRLSAWVKTEAATSWPMDRYPTSVPACITMASFPFTNHSPSAGGTSDWKKIETLFIASQSNDRVRLHFGFNGNAQGKVWFDDVRLEKVEDITAYIPMESVKWFGPAFRYTDKGWTFVHIEGKPYDRGYQYGFLVANEIVELIKKLANRENENNPSDGWKMVRQIADAFFLRKYDEEYLLEMKGIADGAAKAGAQFDNRPVDFQDIVAINSHVDISYVWSALKPTLHPLSGKSFLKAEDELNISDREHKCSGFLANGPATPNGDIVFGQLFMWSGYTGVHWNMICDVIPEKGHRLVYETFPGGIHSAADFYLNSAGIMIGETTVSQSPFDMNGTPQSNRIRKAAQYASSIDDVVRIMTEKNNGMYTNDWLIGDAKTNETAILLLGTKKYKLWRSKTNVFPGDTKGFYWSNNNAKDDEVRKEYIGSPDNAPYEMIFSPWNRDIAFWDFFKKYNGKIDAITGVNFWASSPINRPHACDGKIITTEMAKQMVFMANFGKVTLREKFPAKGYRLMPDYPNALPHLSLGYSIFSPVFITEKLKALKPTTANNNVSNDKKTIDPDLSNVNEVYAFNPRALWFNTVYPTSDKENWFISATAAYWKMLKELPSDSQKALPYLRDLLNEQAQIRSYVVEHEGAIAPIDAKRVYNAFNYYKIPRINGTFLLHQLRLYLGNEMFSKVMNAIHDQFKEKPVANAQLIAVAEKVAGKPLAAFFKQWLERKDIPQVTPTAKLTQTGDGWQIELKVHQTGTPFHFLTTVAIDTEKGKVWKKIEVAQADQSFVIHLADKPVKLLFNAGNDIPVANPKFYLFTNYSDDFSKLLFIYGTARQIEANHTLTLRFRDLLADQFTETLLPIRKDSEVDEAQLASNDLVVLGNVEDNSVMKKLVNQLGLHVGKNFFQWEGKTYGEPDDGIVLVYPNPYNPKNVAYLIIANSALQLHQMTKVYNAMPSWTLFKGDQLVKKGYHPINGFEIMF
ncbi:MAG: C45 family autoproteolytic acyltransferase/hydrolase [Candidatus Omnitrophota bacterium]